MHILTVIFKNKEIMKQIKIGVKLSSNELTTKLQILCKQAEKKAKYDLLSDSEDEDSNTQQDRNSEPSNNIIEIEASISLSLKQWRRKINLKIIQEDSISLDSQDSDNLSISSNECAKISNSPKRAFQTTSEFFSAANNQRFFEEKFKKMQSLNKEGEKRSKVSQQDKQLSKRIDELLGDWHAYSYNRTIDEGVKQPQKLHAQNMMEQVSTS